MAFVYPEPGSILALDTSDCWVEHFTFAKVSHVTRTGRIACVPLSTVTEMPPEALDEGEELQRHLRDPRLVFTSKPCRTRPGPPLPGAKRLLLRVADGKMTSGDMRSWSTWVPLPEVTWSVRHYYCLQ